MVLCTMKGAIILVLLCVMSCSVAGSPALDSDGDPIRTGVKYKVKDYDVVDIVGLALDGKSCPPNVVRSGRTDPDYGLSMTFHPAAGGQLVNLDSDVNIKFEVSTKCSESTVWKLAYDESIGREVVSTGGELGKETWFRIKPTGLVNFYYLAHCPTNEACQAYGIDKEGRYIEYKDGDYFSPLVLIIAKASETLESPL